MTGTDWADLKAKMFMCRPKVQAALDTPAFNPEQIEFDLAAALRAAHDAGARDMRERAAGTAKVAWLTAPELADGSLRNADQDMRLCDQIEAAIRALQPIPAPHDSEEQDR